MTSGHLDKKRTAVPEAGTKLWPTPGRWRRRDINRETDWETKRYKILGKIWQVPPRTIAWRTSRTRYLLKFCVESKESLERKIVWRRLFWSERFLVTIFTVNKLIRLQLTCYTELTPGFISLSTMYTCTVRDILCLQRRSEVSSTILRFSCG